MPIFESQNVFGVVADDAKSVEKGAATPENSEQFSF
jgi:hypothetical protein